MKTTFRFALCLLMGLSILTVSHTSTASANSQKVMLLYKTPVKLPSIQYWNGSGEVSLESFKGKYVLVNFWATWCAPCVRELPSLQSLAEKINSDKFLVLAISQDQGAEHVVVPYLKRLKIDNLNVLYDPNRKSFKEFALRGLPTTVLISPAGTVIARLEGEVAWDSGLIFEQMQKVISN
jgi:thiol-disulfide isomerase/thioredoxin